jgi:hemerythrin
MMNDEERMRSWMEGFQQIQDDHQRLHHLLGELEEVCCEFYRQESNGPGPQDAASCAGRLNSFSHEFIDFLISHFEREERWISAFPGPAHSMSGAHQRDHVRIVRHLEGLMHDTIAMVGRGNAVSAVQDFHQCVLEVLSAHAFEFDSAMTSGAGD